LRHQHGRRKEPIEHHGSQPLAQWVVSRASERSHFEQKLAASHAARIGDQKRNLCESKRAFIMTLCLLTR
jgi:hypothetical protein